MKRIAFLATAAVVLVLAAGPALASNTGFKLNYPLLGNGLTNRISLPYFYFPSGDVNDPTQNTEDLCDDLMTNTTPCAVNIVGSLLRTGVGQYSANNHPCGAAFGITDLEPGKMYYALATSDCTGDIVGSHDDTYTAGKGSSMITLQEGTNPVSIPYHVVAVNSEDLCVDFNTRYGAGSLQLVTRVDTLSGGTTNHPCGAAFGNFDFTPGEGVFLTPGTFPLDVQWTTY